MVVLVRRYQPLDSTATVQKRTHESNHVGLDLLVRSAPQGLRDAERPGTLVLEEVVAQHLERALRLVVAK